VKKVSASIYFIDVAELKIDGKIASADTEIVYKHGPKADMHRKLLAILVILLVNINKNNTFCANYFNLIKNYQLF